MVTRQGENPARRVLPAFAIWLLLSTLLAIGVMPAQAQVDAETGIPATLSGEDLVLLADFETLEFSHGGERLPFDVIELTGAAYYIPEAGLAAYKGGVNEVPDPGFEGSAWELGPAGSIDTAAASSGTSSLKVTGNGTDGEVASMSSPVPVVAGRHRTVSFDRRVSEYRGGKLLLTIKALDAGGAVLGEGSAVIAGPVGEWERDNSLVFELPDGAASYKLVFDSEGFDGVINLDSVLAEAKDYFTPYFDGDDDCCAWVTAASPQKPMARTVGPSRDSLALRGVLLALAAVLALVAAFGAVYMFRIRLLLFGLIGTTLFAILALILVFSSGVASVPANWPDRLMLQGSHLEPDRTYFYRVSSVGADGIESPPSYEVRTMTGWLDRQVILTWDRDPQAESYRVYRGTGSHAQFEYFEVTDKDASAQREKTGLGYDENDPVFYAAGNSAMFVDSGEPGSAGVPRSELKDTGTRHGSPSLRPDSDIRLGGTAVDFDTAEDFWIAGDLVLGFDSGAPFRPASLFEVGDPERNTSLAVSLRYVPGWGDEEAKIILIENAAFSHTPASEALALPDPDPGPGSRLRYVVARLYEPSGGIAAGTHLWYSFDGDDVEHIYLEEAYALPGENEILISKRYFFDYFSNNSVAKSFAVVSGGLNQGMVDFLLAEDGTAEQVRLMFADPGME